MQTSGLVPITQSGLQSDGLSLSEFDRSPWEHGMKSQKCHWLPNSGKQAAVETPTEHGADLQCPVTGGNLSLWLSIQGSWACSALSSAPEAAWGAGGVVHTASSRSTEPSAPQSWKPTAGSPGAGRARCPRDRGRYTPLWPSHPQSPDLRQSQGRAASKMPQSVTNQLCWSNSAPSRHLQRNKAVLLAHAAQKLIQNGSGPKRDS